MFEKINNILAEWDPIGVGLPISKYEYTQYIPRIIFLRDDYSKLKEYIYTILNNMGMYYDTESETVKNDIENLIYQIQNIR